jgi:hypothetical protein
MLHQKWCKNRWGHGVPTVFAAFTEHKFMLFRARAYLFWLPVSTSVCRPYPGPDAAPLVPLFPAIIRPMSVQVRGISICRPSSSPSL